MSIAYQSWEIGSGPTVGYKVQAHQAAGDGLNLRKLLCRPETAARFMQQGLPPPAPKQRFSSSATIAATTTTTPSGGASKPDEDLPLTKVEVVELVVAPPGGLETTNMPSSSSSLVTSSISNESSDESDDKEVQSAFKGPLDQMDSLMTTLPVRRGLSKFYVGKSRSFTSLADVKSMCMKDLGKPENPYSKRRKLPSHREGMESKPRFPPPRISTGISKKPISSNGTTLTLALAMSTKGDRLDGSDECFATAKQWQKSCRSFSLTDLQKA
ncbi:uncharacterized protein LOC9661322 [Selaginella moellendorffii]|nr:uncharacterized protein LOC9661322 [Selaginella moellendorffii]|eukprot:XP_002982572.2 uncharacterized protein LOC9661322 [Selaginella moellendorffii]